MSEPGAICVDARLLHHTLAKWVDLNLSVRNLLDRNYPGSTDPRAVPAPGVSVVLTANLRF